MERGGKKLSTHGYHVEMTEKLKGGKTQRKRSDGRREWLGAPCRAPCGVHLESAQGKGKGGSWKCGDNTGSKQKTPFAREKIGGKRKRGRLRSCTPECNS